MVEEDKIIVEEKVQKEIELARQCLCRCGLLSRNDKFCRGCGIKNPKWKNPIKVMKGGRDR